MVGNSPAARISGRKPDINSIVVKPSGRRWRFVRAVRCSWKSAAYPILAAGTRNQRESGESGESGKESDEGKGIVRLLETIERTRVLRFRVGKIIYNILSSAAIAGYRGVSRFCIDQTKQAARLLAGSEKLALANEENDFISFVFHFESNRYSVSSVHACNSLRIFRSRRLVVDAKIRRDDAISRGKVRGRPSTFVRSSYDCTYVYQFCHLLKRKKERKKKRFVSSRIAPRYEERVVSSKRVR